MTNKKVFGKKEMEKKNRMRWMRRKRRGGGVGEREGRGGVRWGVGEGEDSGRGEDKQEQDIRLENNRREELEKNPRQRIIIVKQIIAREKSKTKDNNSKNKFPQL